MNETIAATFTPNRLLIRVVEVGQTDVLAFASDLAGDRCVVLSDIETGWTTLPVCRVDVAASSSPVTARMSSGENVFWVRMNNSTRELGGSQANVYVRDHWSDGRGRFLGPS